MSDKQPGRISYSFEDPFEAPPGERRPDRRLRGGLVAPVTVWSVGGGGRRVGLTVSSVLVAEGEPPWIVGLLDPLSELRQAAEEIGRFTVHVLGEGDRRLAAAFAGVYPVDPFEGLEVSDTDFGPRIGDLAGQRTVVSCRYEKAEQTGYFDLVSAVIEGIDLAHDASPPLAYYRGSYTTVREPGK